MKNIFLALLLSYSCASFSQVVINELDTDTPSTDDKEFIELKSETPNFSLNGYVLVFYNGTGSNANLSYFALDLSGITTDMNGIATVGNQLVSPVPDLIFSNSIIQNGPDAVALYIGSTSAFPLNTMATSANLVDALVYDTSDPQVPELMSLLGVTTQINENINNLGTTQSIQRKNDGTYEVKAPTPGANNDGSGFIYNGIRIDTTLSTLNEGESFVVTFTTTTPVTSNLAFDFTLNNGTFNTADFTGNTSVEIPAGSSTFSISVTIVDDMLDEGDELLAIRFGTLPPGYNRVNDNIQIRVVDNDYTTAPWGTPLNPTYGIVANTMPSGYYASLEGKAGNELRQALQDIIANPQIVRSHNYGDVEIILKQADQNPLNSNQVWLMYVEQGRAKYMFQSTASNVGSWNREHIYPQSRGGFANATSSTADGINIWLPTSANDIAAGHSDAHHIRAEDGPENTIRSNRDYGSDYNGPAGNQGSWKGDVARSLFYMDIRYNALSVVNGNPPDTTVGQLGDLASLLAWNMTDPSDDFEMNRNNIIYEWQMNRNPFIDYPQLANYIWGTNVGQPWFSSLSVADAEMHDVVLYPNPAQRRFKVAGISFVTNLEIYNFSGQKVHSAEISTENTINIDLPPGIYMVKMESHGRKATRKLIIR